ncbi:MAG: hypothetical protein HY331_12625 [Chloroflexi bacterium]|nr:hypothetical protein [Chloroflexota bacterium]
MRLRVLGAHQWESRSTRCATLLVDDVLAIDAGSLAAALSIEEQARLRGVLLTHFHYDHIKDLPVVGFNVGQLGTGPIAVVATPPVREALMTHFLNGTLWPRLTEFPSAERPAIAFVAIEVGQWVEVAGHRVRAHRSVHSVPTVGYEVVGADGRSLYYTSDTGAGWADLLPDDLRPHLLITEVTFGDEHASVGQAARHLTPATLRGELVSFCRRHGYLPPVLTIHMNPIDRPAIVRQLDAVARELGVPIHVGIEDQTLDV